MEQTCESLETPGERWQCGREIADQYASFRLRHGSVSCAAIRDIYVWNDCSEEDWQNWENATGNILGAFGKIREGGDSDPAVQEARAAMLACLENAGHGNPDPDLLLFWQKHHLSFEEYILQEESLTEEERVILERLVEPTVSCAEETGLFVEQDSAWAEELRRLQEAEPGSVAHLINEGFMTALERPGVTTYLTPDDPPHVACSITSGRSKPMAGIPLNAFALALLLSGCNDAVDPHQAAARWFEDNQDYVAASVIGAIVENNRAFLANDIEYLVEQYRAGVRIELQDVERTELGAETVFQAVLWTLAEFSVDTDRASGLVRVDFPWEMTILADNGNMAAQPTIGDMDLRVSIEGVSAEVEDIPADEAKDKLRGLLGK